MNHLKDLEKQLVNRLFSWEDKDYKIYSRYVLSALNENEEVSDEHKDTLKDRMRELSSQFEERECDADAMRKISVQAWEEILYSSAESEWNDIEIIEETVWEINWNTLKNTYWIVPLEDWVAYRWWVARVIARLLLSLQQNENDIKHTLNDVDVYTTIDFDHNILSEYYKADSDWIWYLTDLEDATIKKELSKADITQNQIIITKDKMFISRDSADALRTWTSKLVASWRTFFGTQSYEVDWETVYHPRQLMRWLKFLFEWKIDRLEVPVHNVMKDNLETLEIHKQILVFVRRVYQKNYNNRYHLLQSLASFLKTTWIIKEEIDFFEYVENHKQEMNFYFETKAQDIQKDANWKLSKYIKIAINDLIWGNNNKDNLEDYAVNDTSTIYLHDRRQTDSTWEEEDVFWNNLKTFEQKYMQSYINKEMRKAIDTFLLPAKKRFPEIKKQLQELQESNDNDLIKKKKSLELIWSIDNEWTIEWLIDKLIASETCKGWYNWNDIIRNDVELMWRAKDKELYFLRERIDKSICYHPQFGEELKKLLNFELDENILRQDSFSN